ncbi:hypothetical protein PoB_002163100 [Plakobranchus ocellatus]|uniref:Uncharacterized protein n=1 Tax=Plakobranchus ocellatus TaxID=259542 RepID=A0AAV3ZKR7_9GAST|nr:hypothetical protein PoB_002163100 [Plakobranchus ocellatus]
MIGVPPSLILPPDDPGGGDGASGPHSGNDADHETKFSSFDFLALCSTPTWLGPERRKSRRRSRSPMPMPHLQQHGSQGVSGSFCVCQSEVTEQIIDHTSKFCSRLETICKNYIKDGAR